MLLIFTAQTTKIRTGYIPIMESLDKRKILDGLNQENLLEGLPNSSEVYRKRERQVAVELGMYFPSQREAERSVLQS